MPDKDIRLLESGTTCAAQVTKKNMTDLFGLLLLYSCTRHSVSFAGVKNVISIARSISSVQPAAVV